MVSGEESVVDSVGGKTLWQNPIEDISSVGKTALPPPLPPNFPHHTSLPPPLPHVLTLVLPRVIPIPPPPILPLVPRVYECPECGGVGTGCRLGECMLLA